MSRIGKSMTVISLAAAVATAMTLLATGDASAVQRGDRERRPQQVIAADLRSGEPDRIAAAIGDMLGIPPAEWGVELRGAMLEASTREIRERAFGDDPHYALYPMGDLVMQIAELGDVRAAPSLARHGGFGPRVLEVLVELGEPGLQALLEFALETQPDDGEFVDQQRLAAALHLFAYEWGVEAFDAGSLARIRAFAERALAGPTAPEVLNWGAMGLGLLVGGPELRAVVEEMAASDDAVRKRFSVRTDPSWNASYEAFWIEIVREEAAYLLTDPQRTPYYRRPGCEPNREFPKPPRCRS